METGLSQEDYKMEPSLGNLKLKIKLKKARDAAQHKLPNVKHKAPHLEEMALGLSKNESEVR